MGPFQRYAPGAGAVVLYLAVAAFLYAAVLGAAGGAFTYALDDAYIHMAVAKNLALHGTWGINPGEFASVSSSPLWTLLLGGLYAFAGPAENAPLLLNLLFGVLALWLFDRLMEREGLGTVPRCGLSALFLFAAPLPALAFTGQEHTLHVLLTLVFFMAVLRGLDDRTVPARPRDLAALGLAAAAMTACRYEGAFLALAAGVLFALRRDWRRFLAAGAASALPVVVYGLVSLAEGWSFLPNSLLLKGFHPDFGSLRGAVASLGGTAFRQLMQTGHLLMPFLAGLLYLWLTPSGGPGARDRSRPAVALFLASALLHLQFARTGWFYRYEAWLVALALAALATAAGGRRWSLPDRAPQRRAAGFALLLIALAPFAARGYGSLVQVPRAAANIFGQQRQWAEFLRREYPGAAVAVNDVGAAAFYADCRLLDLWGLADRRAARHKMDRTYSTAVIGALARERGVEVAVLYEDWFDAYGGFPSEWEKVGRWTIRDNLVCGRDAVAFYAVAPGSHDRLIAALRAYAPHLPPSVVQSGLYLEP